MEKDGNHKTYISGKDFKGDLKKPLIGVPNTNIDTRNKRTGELVSRRKIDSMGQAEKDLDKAHPSHKKKGDHAHDIEKGKRGPSRDLTKKEKIELDKASRKRRVYKDD